MLVLFQLGGGQKGGMFCDGEGCVCRQKRICLRDASFTMINDHIKLRSFFFIIIYFEDSYCKGRLSFISRLSVLVNSNNDAINEATLPV